MATDWLILTWFITWGCYIAIICAIGLLVNSIRTKDTLNIYNYATALADVILFTVGSMYFVAGKCTAVSVVAASIVCLCVCQRVSQSIDKSSYAGNAMSYPHCIFTDVTIYLHACLLV